MLGLHGRAGMYGYRWAVRLVIYGVASIFAGLFFALRDLFPYLAAKRSGAIKRRGYAGLIVRREEDPDRFRKLTGARLRGVLLGLALSVGGAAAAAAGLFLLRQAGKLG
jgi:hypothetical protein